MRVDDKQFRGMRSILVAGSLVIVSGFVSFWLQSGGARASEPTSDSKMVRHFVAFKFKKTAKPKDIREIMERFKQLQKKIPFVVSIESGPNTSTEHLNKGFTDAFLVTFNNSADRDRYLTHPEHLKFVALLKNSMDDSFVFDFSSSETTSK